MSSAWHYFVIIGTLGSLAAMLWLLYANRRTSGEETTGHEWDGIRELDNPLPMWWVGMFVASVVFSIGYLIYYPGLGNLAGAGGWTQIEQWQNETEQFEARFEPLYRELAALDPQSLQNDPRAQQVGRRLYLNYCATCHGSAARGAPGFPDLTDDHWIWGSGFDAVLTSISSGRVAAMPPWGAVLGPEGVTDTTAYVLKLAGREHDPEAAARGATRYQQICVSCHGPEGHGNAVLGAPDITADVWLYGGDNATIATTIRDGRNGNMPAHGDLLGAERARILSAYVTSLTR